MPPQGWQDHQDVLSNLDHVPEPPKSVQPVLSPRSRSSSKVRFAEDTDDFDVRSNPSTSSRSVPERWGGMEIPDAERDAGKEILYQITQQAFNELLDELFKKKEDLAVRAAETKKDRSKYRHLLENIDLEQEDDRSAGKTPQRSQTPSPATRVPPSPPIPERSLNDLLSTSGYAVALADEGGQAPEVESGEQLDAQQSILLAQGHDDEPVPIKAGEPANGREEDDEASDLNDAEIRHVEFRDPTMPQFRPNTTTTSETRAESSLSGKPKGKDHRGVQSQQSASPPATANATGDVGGSSKEKFLESKLAEPDTEDHIPHSTLVTWKRLELAEQEARERGGWGRLNYEEFEAIYREHEFQDSSRNRLDYLGSWIDFCIP